MLPATHGHTLLVEDRSSQHRSRVPGTPGKTSDGDCHHMLHVGCLVKTCLSDPPHSYNTVSPTHNVLPEHANTKTGVPSSSLIPCIHRRCAYCLFPAGYRILHRNTHTIRTIRRICCLILVLAKVCEKGCGWVIRVEACQMDRPVAPKRGRLRTELRTRLLF